MVEGASDITAKALIVIALLTFLTGNSLRAEEIEYKYGGDESFRYYLTKTLPKNLLLGSYNTFTGANLAILGTGGGAAVLLSQTDTDRYIQDSLNDSLGKLGKNRRFEGERADACRH